MTTGVKGENQGDTVNHTVELQRTLLLRVTALFVAKGWVLGSLRKAVLLSLWKEGMEKKEKQERAVHSSKEKG